MWTWLKDGLFACINWCYMWCGDWGLAIIVITILFRALIYPLTVKQVKSTYAMKKIQPKMQALQVKYADDQQRLQEEMKKLYADAKANPLSGCLPVILQMPIFIILFQVLNEYLPDTACFYNLVPNLTWAPKAAWEQGLVFSIPYLVLVALFALSTFIPMMLQGNSKDKQNMIMGLVMTVFMLWISWSSPGGVLLYWDVSSIIGVIQQQAMQYRLKLNDEEAEAQMVTVEPVHVDVERRVRKPKPKKKGK